MKTVIKKIDGGVEIMTLVNGADETECVNKWKLRYPGKYVSHRQMPDSAIPVDRDLRDSWTDTTPELVIDIDLTKANANCISKVKGLRKAALDSFVKVSPGISRIYSENYFASTEFQAGRTTTPMVDGSTVAQYLGLLGSRIGMTATQFAAYIINENRGTVGLAIKAKDIEDEYLRLVYTAMPAMTGAQAVQAVTDYTAFCDARKLL